MLFGVLFREVRYFKSRRRVEMGYRNEPPSLFGGVTGLMSRPLDTVSLQGSQGTWFGKLLYFSLNETFNNKILFW